MLPPWRSSVPILALVWLLGAATAGAQNAAPVPFRTPSVFAAHAGASRPLAQLTNCQPQWLPTFGGAPAAVSYVDCLLGADLGDGPALYLGGLLYYVGGGTCSGIVRWDGHHWDDLGGGVLGGLHPEVYALCVYDDGNGPALYVGGSFDSAGGVAAPYLARWDGTHWSAVGSGVGGVVRCMCVFDDGSGPALYIGGQFLSAGGVTANRIARWDGTSFTPVGGGAGNPIRALQVFDDGTGPSLYATGLFGMAGGQPAAHIARWDGSNWSAVGGGFAAWGNALAVHDDGSGRALYVGYSGSGPVGVTSRNVAKWDASGWHSVGSGIDGEVDALSVYDDGTGAALYAGGEGISPPSLRLKRWDGAQWIDVAGPVGGLRCLALTSFDDGHGDALYAGGYLGLQGTMASTGVARLTGQSWSEVSDGGLDGSVEALAALDDGTGAALYAGGDFGHAGDLALAHIGRWDGSGWRALGSGLDGTVLALAGFDDGSGRAVFAGGDFTNSGGASMRGIARWDGTSWSPVGLGLNGAVNALCVHDDGNGPALYASGAFSYAGQQPANHYARWDGHSWSPLGNGSGTGARSLVSFDDGAGSQLYAADAGAIRRWNGANWSTVGQSDGDVYALCLHDDGGGPALYAGGHFWAIDGVQVSKVARWSAGVWSSAGYQPWFGVVESLGSFPTSQGPRLAAGGSFDVYGPGPGSGIAQWDGSTWTPMGSGVSGNYGPHALVTFDDGSGPALFAGGRFLTCADSRDSYLGKWGSPAGCGYSGAIVCEPGTGGVSACPCANPPSAAGRGCDNSSATGGASLQASGRSSLAQDKLVLATSGETASATSVVLQGDALSASGTGFGQGVRCVTGSLKRLYVKTAVGGSISAPGAGDASISARSAALGAPITQGVHRYYGVYYRDPTVLGGCPALSTFNLTQQLDVLWQP